MKKIYTLVAAIAVFISANAQNRAFNKPTSEQSSSRALEIKTGSLNRAAGDTLMWYPAPGIYLASTADQAAFTLEIEDIDGLTPNNAGETMDFGLYFSDDNSMAGSVPTADNFYHPWENPILGGGADSTFWWRATSWFSPAGQADNWFMMGPITLPAGGVLSWTDRTNPAYRDGYKVYISTVVSTPTTFTDFSGAAVYTKTDSYPSTTYTTDTTWVVRTVAIPSMFNGQSIYVAFNHTANDMDVLHLDEFLIVEAPVGINEFVNGAKLTQNVPNPASAMTTISYELENSSAVAFNVYDVTGKLVHARNIGNVSAGTHNIYMDTENLAAGVYHYSLTVNNVPSSAMKMVVIK